jgi:hypothetical protein
MLLLFDGCSNATPSASTKGQILQRILFCWTLQEPLLYLRGTKKGAPRRGAWCFAAASLSRH